MSNINNKYLAVFLIASGLAVGSVLVYAKNHMSDADKIAANQQLSQFSNQAVPDQTEQTQTQAAQTQQAQSQAQQSGGTSPQGQVAGAQANSAQTQTQTQTQNQAQTQAQQPQLPPESLPAYTGGEVTQLQMKDEVVGTGPAVKSGDNVEVNYIGTFLDGKKFDASYDRNQTFSFIVGAGNVIQGWDQGLVGMQTGGKRLLIIPSDLAYGAAGAGGSIPPNTPLMFEVQLVSIK